jgi:hypothetical protein
MLIQDQVNEFQYENVVGFCWHAEWLCNIILAQHYQKVADPCFRHTCMEILYENKIQLSVAEAINRALEDYG